MDQGGVIRPLRAAVSYQAPRVGRSISGWRLRTGAATIDIDDDT
jgi:hypothetical protein